ncbi:hypothetical protein PHLGIDRAFT_420124 [Phlebiopsis gigantea 11061_1 CR5-6]|uniref:Uncharacterized protein n=1 Tax=Phlebiopsis gigantea (strain 11061_1 CR5-6) TaxID=745531 RepID=A0A0C3PLP4_PHLG1|nr:hypothetical protein PHLGIDRAFT_420124 [Phlebiopsis gigantea 11061_1 CR5-6]
MSLEQPDILIDPDLIPETILEDHRRENRTRALPDGLLSLILHGTRGHTFPIVLENVGWRLMLENGLASALIDCVLDEHLCGFSRAELTSWPGDGEDAYLTDVLPYVNRLLRGIIMAAAFLRECQTHPREGRPAEARVKADMHAIWCASHEIWRRLWDIRTPFLDAQPRGRAFTHGSPIQLQFHLHYFSAVLANYEIVAHPSYPEPAPEVPNRRQHVMLVLWMHAERRRDRTVALIEAKVAVEYEEIHFGDSTWSDLYEEVFAGRAQGRELLHRAMVRGFGAEEDIGLTVHSLFTFVCAFWPPHELGRENLIPRDVLVASIASWRTQICMSDARGVARDEDALYLAMDWQLKYLLVPQQRAHGAHRA